MKNGDGGCGGERLGSRQKQAAASVRGGVQGMAWIEVSKVFSGDANNGRYSKRFVLRA